MAAPTTDAMAKAFIDENPYAAIAQATVDQMQALDRTDPDLPVMAKSAEIYATLAVAFEQRQTRFDLYTGLENHAQQTGRS
jgi:hypothetical protein